MSNRGPLVVARGAAFSLCLAIGLVLLGGSSVKAIQNGLNSGETLAQLIALNGPGGGVQIGNLIFNNFGYVGSPSPNPAPTASNITVSNSPFTGTGLQFNAAWMAFDPGGDTQESDISYSVQAVAGFTITQVRLDFNGHVVAPSTGAVPAGNQTSVTESVSQADGNGTPIGSAQHFSVFDNANNSGGTANNTSNLALSPSDASIFVQKDIQLAAAGGGVTTISWAVNTYTVATAAVPEPATMAFIAMSGVGLLLRRRRA